uniref:Saposin B-type domain-containing protein n=1 Tax=Steinernema glaseri TaxID=37863 RepID=A0A1I8AR79_9BILA
MLLDAVVLPLFHVVLIVFSFAFCAISGKGSNDSSGSVRKHDDKRDIEIVGCEKCYARVADLPPVPKPFAAEDGRIVDKNGVPLAQLLCAQG